MAPIADATPHWLHLDSGAASRVAGAAGTAVATATAGAIGTAVGAVAAIGPT
ncbi:hypothetical protein [Mycolicibacterium sp. CBMA 361]|uniref:hypothetical protein n=1 Tax=Mycolicibacterium sp. CBMA 361 TaxID=2606610 RepID=UPI0012DCE438|nr:hypothetical protein [Mycolicibacterium sp. CBMA 361]